VTTNKQSGIYRIKNLETGTMYIGRTAQPFASRWADHRRALKAGCHDNSHLQRSYNKHGKDTFEYKAIEIVPQDNMSDQEFNDYLNKREMILIAEHDTFSNGYNLSEGGGGALGHTVSAEARAKISASAMGRTLSAETRAKISAVQTGRKASDETKANMSKSLMGNTNAKGNRGRKHTAEHRAKISKAQMGYAASEATRAKISKALKGRKLSDDHKAKLSSAFEGRTITTKTRAKISESLKGHPVTTKTRAKLSVALKGKPWTAARRAAQEERKEPE